MQLLRASIVALALTISLSAAEAPAPAVANDFVPAGPDEPLGDAGQRAMESIAARNLAAHVAFLASPALEGRGLGQPGVETAAEYVAAQLRLAGVEPFADDGNDAGWFQQVPVRRVSEAGGTLEIARRDGGLVVRRKFASGVDVVVSPAAPQTVEGAVVFAGYGIREPKLARDDYAGLDVRGKIVVVLAGLPPGEEWKSPALVTRFASNDMDDRFVEKLEIARDLGAAAMIAIEGAEFETSVAKRAKRYERGFRAHDESAGLPPLVQVSRAAGRAILGDASLDAALASGKLKSPSTGVTATIEVSAKIEAIVSRNVIGIIRGSDAAFAGEAVVIGAHVDHLGREGDDVYFGADDNASGSAALLEIAKAFATLPRKPKRTVVICFWTGEEEGKFGSGYYVRHPRWPLEKTAAYINLDMVGHPWLREEIAKLVTDVKLPDGDAYLAKVKTEEFMEIGLPRGVPMLESAVRRAARANGFPLHLDWTDGRHGGSDYRDFARAGVPFLRFFGNFFPGYHEPTDTAGALDAKQVERNARMAFAAAWEIVNAER